MTLEANYDSLLLDLDGTVYAGANAIPGAQEALAAASTPLFYVTNNASRSPEDVADHLTELGFPATTEQVITSAQAGAKLLASLVDPGTRVLVVGANALVAEVTAQHLIPVTSFDDDPGAVIQGHNPDTGWRQLSEAVLAIRAGAVWVACNVDATLPSERGLLAGNGSMVAAVAHATGAQPTVAGKPGVAIMHDAVERAHARTPLVIGDRLDTDIEGANAAELDSLLVLTGVNTAADTLRAPGRQQPTYLAGSLAALNDDSAASAPGDRPGWTVTVSGTTLHLAGTADADATTAIYPLLAAARTLTDEQRATITVEATGADHDAATRALTECGLSANV